MRPCLSFIFPSLICLTAIVSAQTLPRWQATGGPSGGNGVDALLVIGTSLYAGLDGNGVFESNDQGQTWEPRNNGLTNVNVQALIQHNGFLFAGTDGGGVFRSNNGGTSWTPVNSGLTGSRVTGLAARGSELWVSTFSDSGVFRSTNNGQTWQQITAGLNIAHVYSIAAAGDKIIVVGSWSVCILDANATAWRSLDMVAARFAETIVAVTSIGSTIYIGSLGGGVARSTDSGLTWNRVNAGLHQNIGSLAAFGNVLFAGTGNGLFVSTNEGVTWTRLNEGLGSFYSASFTKIGTTFFVGVSSGTVYTYNDSLPSVTTASAATFQPGRVATESIVSIFGTNLSNGTEVAAIAPLPITLNGVRALVRDSASVDRPAPLFFVSPSQINLQIPPGTARGLAVILIISTTQSLQFGGLEITGLAPGVFTANASGQGVAAAYVLRVKSNGAQSTESVFQYDATLGRFVPTPIDVSNTSDQVFLVLFGTGIRGRPSLASVLAQTPGGTLQVTFAGAAPGFVGLDQVNLRLPSFLQGRGLLNLDLSADLIFANRVQFQVR